MKQCIQYTHRSLWCNLGVHRVRVVTECSGVIVRNEAADKLVKAAGRLPQPYPTNSYSEAMVFLQQKFRVYWLLLFLRSQLYLCGSPFWVRFLRLRPTLVQPLRQSHSVFVDGTCWVFVAGIHPSRTWMAGSMESVRWVACVHRLDLSLNSHPKEF